MRRFAIMLACLACSSAVMAQERAAPQPAAPASPSPQPPAAPSAEEQRGVLRTEAMRLLSEADQFMSDSRHDQAFERLSTLRQKYTGVLTADEINTVAQQFEQARSTLGLLVLADGRVLPMTKDEDIDGLLAIMPGSYATDRALATDGNPTLTYNAARVLISGLTNAVYFEVGRADDLANPFRQGIISFVRIGGKVRLRIMDIANPPLREALVGLWAAPEAFPSFAASDLAINVELDVTRAEDGSAYVAKTAAPFPTYTGGAVEMTSRLRISSDALSIADRGLDASGAIIWGPPLSNEAGLVFRHVEPPARVTRHPGGLITIDLVPGETGGYALGLGGDVALHFSQWTTQGVKMDSSRNAARGPARVRYPVGSIAGLDQGLLGITKGTRRRVVIPPELGYGNQPRGPIPANSTLVFDLEVMWLQPPPEPPPTPPVEPAGPAGPPSPPSTPSPPGPPAKP